MKNILKQRLAGFTLIEMLTTITIIGILASIILVSFNNARANSRDKARMSDIAQLELALRLYVEQNGSDIGCSAGMKIDGDTTVQSVTDSGNTNCPEGAQILTFIESFYGSVPHDPRGPGDEDYYYYYDNRHPCNNTGTSDTPLVFAANLESGSSNVSDVCAVREGTQGGWLSTPGQDPSNPYVKKLNFTTEVAP